MKHFHSIRWRLQFWYGVLLALVLTGFGAAAYEYQRTGLLRATDEELERRAGAWARALQAPARHAPRPPEPVSGNPEPSAPARGMEPAGPPPREPNRPLWRPPPPEEAAAAEAADGSWYRIRWQRNGSVMSASAGAPADCPRPAGIDLQQGPHVRVRGPFREAVVNLGRDDVILVGRNLTPGLRELYHFAWLLGGVAVAILALALLGGRWLVGRSLRPIAEISAAAEKIARGDLSQRISTQDADSELGQLAEVLNSTFARLEDSFAHQARFTADAAHELRTPLSVLLTHTQNALGTRCEVEEHQEAFAACQRAAQRMRALIESLLRLARLDSGELTMRRIEFDLARRVAESVELLRSLAAQRGIAIQTDLQPAVCPGDPEQIDRVVVNLVTNAVEHNVEHGEVRVTTKREPAMVVLNVADRGPGIPAEHLPRLFERFYRADKSRSRASGGVGLGLAIAKAIVEAHHGTITVESQPGQGTVFTVRLPG